MGRWPARCREFGRQWMGGALVVLSLVACCFVSGGCRGGKTDRGAVEEPTGGCKTGSRWKKGVVVRHSHYSIEAQLPPGWEAIEERDDVVPCDRWVLRPEGEPLTADNARRITRIVVSLAWLPRPSRMTAGFPGGRAEDARTDDMVVAGRRVPCVVEHRGRSWLADVEVGELALSVRLWGAKPWDVALARRVAARLKVDRKARPKGYPSVERRALDLAREFAAKQGLEHTGIVWTGNDPEDAHRVFLTIFHEGGVTALVVDTRQGKVEERSGS